MDPCYCKFKLHEFKATPACTRAGVNIYKKRKIIGSDKLLKPAVNVHTDYTNNGRIQKNKKQTLKT